MIEKIKLIDALIAHELPASEFLVVNSAWLAMLGIRINGDLDMIMSSRLRAERFADIPVDSSFGLPGPLERRLRVQAQNHRYGQMFGARDLDDVITNHGIEIDGLRFIEPRFYFEATALNVLAKRAEMSSAPMWARWHHRLRHKHERDLRALNRFFAAGRQHQAWLSVVAPEQWSGPTFAEMVPNAPRV
jgi:hypothetical protein